MKIFILILWLKSGYGYALTTQEFNSKDNCLVAAREFTQVGEGTFSNAFNAICVEK